MERYFRMIDNYVYMYHTGTLLALPTYADSITDVMSVNFVSSTPLARSSPIYSYANSGPRQLSFTFNLHRDMMQAINYGVSNLDTTINDDYVDYLINSLQACAVPEYSATDKMVDPPMVAVRLGNDIFIKGVVLGNVSVTYELPILTTGKYASAKVSFVVAEVDPYSADTIQVAGSFRGLSTSLERNVYKNPSKGGLV